MYYFVFLNIVIGLFIGSFLNVVGLRSLTKESVVFPPSHCPNCNHKLNPLDLFPVISYVSLKGKCRYCKTKISPIYPIGELMTALGFGIVSYKYGLSLDYLINIVFICFLMVGTVTDMKDFYVSNKTIVTGIISVFILQVLNVVINKNIGDLLFSVGGMIGSFLVLYIIFLFSGEKMGGADVKLYALIGLSIGFYNSMFSLFYASIISLVVVGILAGLKKVNIKDPIPFVPFITLGVYATYLINLNLF